MTASEARLDELIVLAAAGVAAPASDRGPRDWRDGGEGLVRSAAGSRLAGALVAAEASGAVRLDEVQLDQLHRVHVDALAWCLRLEDRLCEVAEAFAAGGITDLRVLKGPAIAHLDEDDPSTRTFGDLDLLVRGSDLDRAVALLEAMGATRPYPERRPGFDRRFAKSVTLTFPDRVEVDLHRTLCDGVHAVRLPVERLWADRSPFQLAGVDLAGLGPTARLLHSAYHAVLGSPVPAPMSRRDLLGYLGRSDVDDGDGGGLAAAVAEAERWGGIAVLHEAVASVRALPGAEVPAWEEWADGVAVTDREWAIVAAQRRDGSSYGPSRLRVLAEMDGWRDRLAFVHGVLVPSREHLQARGLTRRGLLGRPGRRR